MNVNSSHDPFIAHLRVEHRHIRDLIREVLQHLDCFSTGEDVKTSNGGQLRSQLTSLRNEMARHFSQEESGGCLEEAVCRCPSLASEATNLEKEHAELLAELDNVLGCSETTATGEDASSLLDVAFRQFVDRLEKHEERERKVLQSAFGTVFDGVEFLSH